MDNLNINTGEIRLAINGDEDNLLIFNPEDIVFAEKFYNLATDFAKKEKEFNSRIEAIQANNEVDEYNIPENTGDAIEVTKDMCIYMRERLDYIFGEGTSQRVFGDVMSIDAIMQLLEGIEPYIAKAREKKAGQYTRKVNKSVLK